MEQISQPLHPRHALGEYSIRVLSKAKGNCWTDRKARSTPSPSPFPTPSPEAFDRLLQPLSARSSLSSDLDPVCGGYT